MKARHTRKIFVAAGLCLPVLALLLTAAPVAAANEPRIGISPPQVNFGGVDLGETKSKVVKVRNKGKANLEISAIGLCDGTSGEFAVSAGATTLAPKEVLEVEISYTPAEAGGDKGCVAITSNDPKNPTVEVDLRGRGVDDTPTANAPDIDLSPGSLDFGQVAVGGSKTRSVKVKNKGAEALEGVMVGRCVGTSEEYSWSPTEMFSVPPDENVEIEVTYAPVDLGTDDGCLEIASNDPDEELAPLELSGTGVETVTDGVDLDIFQFKVKKKVRLDSEQSVSPRLWVKNAGQVDEERTAVVVGMQGDVPVYEEEMLVSDRIGNQGKNRYRFPPYAPTEGGEIIWMAVIDDDDPDVDEAFSVTWVESAAGESIDIDLDATKLKATKKVSLAAGRLVRLRAWVRNGGSLDEPRPITLSGTQGTETVYEETIDVSDSPGDGAASRYAFTPYQPVATGDILWTLTIADDDPDVDVRSTVTRVLP